MRTSESHIGSAMQCHAPPHGFQPLLCLAQPFRAAAAAGRAAQAPAWACDLHSNPRLGGEVFGLHAVGSVNSSRLGPDEAGRVGP